jgi:hypothetical protein
MLSVKTVARERIVKFSILIFSGHFTAKTVSKTSVILCHQRVTQTVTFPLGIETGARGSVVG